MHPNVLITLLMCLCDVALIDWICQSIYSLGLSLEKITSYWIEYYEKLKNMCLPW